MAEPADPNPSLTGHWGGDRARFSLDSEGGRLEEDSAFSWFKGAVRPDAEGRFRAEGYYQFEGPGPQRAQSVPLHASFEGKVHGDVLELVFEREDAEPQRFTMEAGRFVRLFRCL